MTMDNYTIDRLYREAYEHACKAERARSVIVPSLLCSPLLGGIGVYAGLGAKNFWDAAQEHDRYAQEHDAKAHAYAQEHAELKQQPDHPAPGLRSFTKQKHQEYVQLAADYQGKADTYRAEAGLSGLTAIVCTMLAALPLLFRRLQNRHRRIAEEKKQKAEASRR
jgi:hypothetical protein